MISMGNIWLWSIFFVTILSALAIDIFAFHGKSVHKVSIKESLSWTSVWFTLAILFNFLIWYYLSYVTHSPLAIDKSVEFFTAYILEKSLSVDNLFVFLMIFHYFAVNNEYQRRVLLYGILGAIIMRFIVISFGIYLVNQFDWILYVFGAFLAITGIKMFIFAEKEADLSKNPILIWMNKHLRVTHEIKSEKFFVRQNNKIYATPLFLALIIIEVSDLIFAVDSIPAVFSVTRDTFIVFTSNIFAILGLRAMYFLLANVSNRFRLLKYGIAIILFFIGVKMLIVHWIKVPIIVSLSAILIILTASMLLSIQKTKKIS